MASFQVGDGTIAESLTIRIDGTQKSFSFPFLKRCYDDIKSLKLLTEEKAGKGPGANKLGKSWVNYSQVGNFIFFLAARLVGS